MERTMKMMGALMIVGALAACDSGNVTGPSVVIPGPGGSPGPGPDVENGADIQGSGILATESRNVAGFSRVRLDGVGHLIVEQGGAEGLTVTADDNILPLVTAEVYGDELRLGTDPGATWAAPNPIVFTLTIADLEALGVFGAAAAEIRGLEADRFAIRIEGAATVTASGRADEQDVVLRGVATYDARDLQSRAVRVDVAGVSRATVRVHESLEGRVDGQSTLEYIGHPAVDVTGAALEHPPDERPAFLEKACAGNEELRREVESLLAHHDDSAAALLSEAPTAVRPAKPAPPSRIGPYRLVQKLGEGGMGEVYEAEQEVPVKRRVAIKLVKWGMSSDEVLARFESERQALALMSHPNIARVYDAGATGDGRPYFAMEHVPGVPITAYCDTHRLSVEERLKLFIQVCHGVQHAHQKGVIHRDLKPSNILVTLVDDEPVPKIIDFGVAKATSARLTERTLFTQLGQWIGTPEYMSPEQAEMTGLDIDTRTDVYSLGVVLYELLVGARPFEPDELRALGFDELRRTIREKEPTRPSTRVSGMGADSQTAASNRRTDPPSLARGLRGDLDGVTMKALEKDRTRRYGSPADLGADLERHLRHEPVLASPPSTAYRVRKFVRRHRVGVAASAVVVLALVVAVVGTSIGLLRARREAENARLLGRLHYWSGDHRQARLTLQRALEVYETAYGPEHPEVASALTTLGFVLWRSGEWALARSRLERALAIEEGTHRPDPKRVSNVLYFLGVLGLDMRDYDRARSVLQRSLTLREEALGPDHPQVGWALHELGRADLDTLNLEAARPLLERALTVQEGAYGPDNPVVAYPLTKLAHIHSLEGDHATADTMFERALAIRERALGPDHPDLTWTLRPWGTHLVRSGDRAGARRLYERALTIAENAWGPEHVEVVFCLSELGVLELADGDLERARSLYQRALAIERKTLAPDSPHIQASLYWLARIESRAGNRKRALEHLRETVEAGWARPGSLDDPDLASLRGDPRFEALKAEVEGRSGEPDQERSLLRE